MSYRDLRNLCEILRAVGYPRLVSIENFRTPNFPLVADISRWLVLQYEPKANIPDASSDTESDRVTLIRAFAEFMLINVQVKLNTKRLYQADGYAVKELLKVACVLYNAVRDAESSENGLNRSSNVPSDSSSDRGSARVDVRELKETRSLASQLVQKGVSLYDMLSKEVNLREARSQALSKAYEHAEVERLIKSAIETGGQEYKKMTSIIETVQNNLSTIEGKIDKKKSELERSQKRLQTLKKVRPAFMDEYEELQKDLAVVYEDYVNRFRCLAHIQHQIDDMDKAEEARKMEERLTKADLSSRRAGGGGDDLLSYGNGKVVFLASSDEDEDDQSDDDTSIGGMKQTIVPPSTTGNSSSRSGNGGRISNVNGDIQGRKNKRKIFGNMMGDSEDDESDMILVDNDNSDLASEDDDDDDEELAALQKNPKDQNKMRERNGAHHRAHGRGDAKPMNGQNESAATNGGLANGGKGYPTDPGRAIRPISKRPITGSGGRRTKPTTNNVTTSDDDDF